LVPRKIGERGVVAMPAGVGVGHAVVEVECPNPVATIVLQLGKVSYFHHRCTRKC